MSMEYDLEEKILFPNNLYEKFIDGYYIIVAIKKPNWLVLNEEEYLLFQELMKGISIRNALENYYMMYCRDENKCLSLMTDLLSQIYRVDFNADAKSLPEEHINSIVKKVHIGTTNGCNMHCKHCYMEAGTVPIRTIDLKKTIQLVDGLNKLYGKLEVVVSGGEPLTYRYIGDLLKAIKNNYIIMFTNGSMISEGNIEVIAECCDEVQISFEGVSKEYYSLVRGKQNYDRALHAIDLLKNYNKKIVLAVTILPDTLEDIRDNLLDFVKKINYSNIEVRINDEIEMSGNALSMDMSSYNENVSKETMIQLIKELQDLGCIIQSSDIRNVRFTNCGIGTTVLINYDGKIYPCHKLSGYALEIGTDIQEVVNEFNKINEVTSNDNIEKCHFCELRYICSGGCRIDNFLINKDMRKVICDEKFKEKQYKKLLNEYKMYYEN